jgi:release factor glutamine methyltransferase
VRVTVLEVIQRSTDYLARKGVEAPRRNVEELLAQQLRLPRLQLYLNFERQLTPVETEVLRALVKRRGQREPLQHILGSVSFCGLELAVSRQVLVPRPETELLAERAWQDLRARQCHSPVVLDFGTGSGCLAISLAVKIPEARIDAVDISKEALELARQNAAAHGASGRIRFLCGDGWSALPGAPAYDLIVSNPPYIPSDEINTLQPEVRDYDPRLALDGGPDGLDFFRLLAREAGPRLKPAGQLMVEFGDGQAEPVRRLLSAQNWVVEATVEDYSRRPRIMVAQRG